MKRFLLILSAALVLGFTLFSPCLAEEAADVCSVVRIPLTRGLTPRALFSMGSMSPCGAVIEEKYVDVVLQSADIAALKKSGVKFEIIEENLDDQLFTYKERGDLGVYHSVPEIEAKLHQYAADYPEITRLESIGKSWEDRDIWALKISDNPAEDEDEPACLIMGAHHAREWISYEVPLTLIERLLTGYGSDERLTGLVDEREIWIVPVVNPDGVTWSHEEYSMWRKNRRPAPESSRWGWGGSKMGVDLNRNYGWHWGGAGTSSYPGSDTYKGPEAFSEKESQAIRDFTFRENFVTSTSFHSYSELVLYPFGYAYDVPNPHEPVFKKMAREMGKLCHYKSMNSADLYPAAGDSEDWLYGGAGVFSILIELAKRFVPSDHLVPEICETNADACLYQIEQAADLVEERTRHIAEVQSYIESMMKKASREQRELNDAEKQEYMKMLRVRNVFRNRLVEEVTGDESLAKARTFSATLKELPANLRSVFTPAVNEVLSALRAYRLEANNQYDELVRDLLEHK